MIKHLIILLLFYAGTLRAQELNYINFDTKDGLAGSTVYDMCQDKDGFMWFATANGLSRFDGSSFKNYTVKDGLPDNEVLKLFADHKGRVWIGTFNKEICFIYQGKIHSRQNDSLIKKIHFTNLIGSLAEDDEGRIALSDGNKYVFIINNDAAETVTRYYFPGQAAISYFYSCSGKKIVVGDRQYNVYLFNGKNFEYFSTNEELYMEKGGKSRYFSSYISCDGKVKKYILKKANYITTVGLNNYLLFCNTYDGAWSIDTVNNRWDVHYLKGKKVTQVVRDAEQNLWFSTIGEGIYKLPSSEVRTIKFPEQNGISNTEVFSLGKYNGKIVAGLNQATAAFVSSNHSFNMVNYAGLVSNIWRPQTNRLYSYKNLTGNSVVFGFDLFLVREEGNNKTYNYIFPIKSVDQINSQSILVGTSSFALILGLPSLQILDTVWRERCTKVLYHAGKYYIGTMAGLYEVNNDKSYTYLGGLHPSLKRRITDIKAATDGTLWVATADQGVVGVHNNRVVAVIKDSNGLSSNICNTLFMKDNFLWAGTNKGLNKIDIHSAKYPVTKYSTSDGLPSDIINAVYAEDSMVYVGSPAGLTLFNENNISSYSICRLYMQAITVSGRDFDSNANILSYKQNNIQFSYTGVSLKSAGDITYYYKLKGLNDSWLQTSQPVLDYPSLPSGDYEFQLYAVNKFGVKSEPFSMKFSVETPFWKAGWFYGLLLLAAALLTGWIVNARNKKYHQKLKETNALQKQFAALEQQALQAQMNPHFIFNCLNGIQQYILTGNKEKANEYLTCFARLIRQTLDNSGKKAISIEQEIKYLTEYLEMEKMRAAGSFTYSITAGMDTDKANTEIPAMLLQPYIENALRHGLRYKTAGTGEVKISFAKQEQNLVCTVKDNGVGRAAAAELKSRQHIEYQSKGMSLTARRIDLLNKINDAKITVAVHDLYDGSNRPAGTEVVIQIPLS